SLSLWDSSRLPKPPRRTACRCSSASTRYASSAPRPEVISPTGVRCRARRNACRRALLDGYPRHVREVASPQPRRKRLDELARPRDADGAVADDRAPRGIAEPHTHHGIDARVDVQVHLEPRVLDAEVDLRRGQHEPEHAVAAVLGWHAAKVELDDYAPRRQRVERDAPPHVPHQELGIEVAALGALPPALP